MKTPCPPWIIGIALVATCDLVIGQDLSGLPGIQIGWASEAFRTNLMADGVATFEKAIQEDGISIQFELGAFKPGFDPRNASQATWADNWIVLQWADYDTGDQQVIETATLNTNVSPFGQNQQAYIWGFTAKEAEPASQWILLAAPSWKWPATTSQQPSTFSVGDATPFDAIIGSVNPASGSYHMQFGNVTVPETSTSLLAATTLLMVTWRRRR